LLKVVGTKGALGPLKTTACGLSNARPAADISPKRWITLTCGFRNQVNPTAYCPSIVSGIFSWRGVMSSLNMVRRLQACPPRM